MLEIGLEINFEHRNSKINEKKTKINYLKLKSKLKFCDYTEVYEYLFKKNSDLTIDKHWFKFFIVL